MNFYVATFVAMNKHGLRAQPHMVTVKARNSHDAEDKVREWLGDCEAVRYEIAICEPIGYDDE